MLSYLASKHAADVVIASLRGAERPKKRLL